MIKRWKIRRCFKNSSFRRTLKNNEILEETEDRTVPRLLCNAISVGRGPNHHGGRATRICATDPRPNLCAASFQPLTYGTRGLGPVVNQPLRNSFKGTLCPVNYIGKFSVMLPRRATLPLRTLALFVPFMQNSYSFLFKS